MNELIENRVALNLLNYKTMVQIRLLFVNVMKFDNNTAVSIDLSVFMIYSLPHVCLTGGISITVRVLTTFPLMTTTLF